MIIFEYGGRSQAICDGCQALVTTTFCERAVAFQSGGGVVKDILVAVCDQCDNIVGIPSQSTPEIKNTLEKSFDKFMDRYEPSMKELSEK